MPHASKSSCKPLWGATNSHSTSSWRTYEFLKSQSARNLPCLCSPARHLWSLLIPLTCLFLAGVSLRGSYGRHFLSCCDRTMAGSAQEGGFTVTHILKGYSYQGGKGMVAAVAVAVWAYGQWPFTVEQEAERECWNSEAVNPEAYPPMWPASQSLHNSPNVMPPAGNPVFGHMSHGRRSTFKPWQ